MKSNSVFASFDQSSHRRRAIRPKLLGAIIAVSAMTTAVVGPFAAASSATTSNQRGHATTVKPDLSYFAGKTISLVLGQAVGGTFGIAANAWVPQLEAYLHATVNISYVPAGNTIVSQNTVASSTPNGLTIGVASAGTDITFFLTNTPGLTFALQKQIFLTGLHLTPVVIATCPGSNITSWDQVAKSSSPTSMLEVTGVTLQHTQVLMGAYGIPVHFVTAYSNTSLQAAGCLRGDGQTVNIAAATFPPAEYEASGGPIRPLLLTTPALKSSAYYNDLKDVPTITSYFAKHKPTTAAGKAAIKTLLDLVGPTVVSTIVTVPPGTPKRLVVTLQDAFKYAMHKATVLNALATGGLIPKYMSPTQVTASIKTIIKKAPTTEKYFTYGS